jgi:hypothetical protein
MLILIVKFCLSTMLVEMCAWPGLPRDHGRLRTDNMRRTVATAPYWLGFVKFNDLPVIDIGTEHQLSRLNIGWERIAR